MEQPEHSVKEIKEALESRGAGWNYRNIQDDESYYRGEVFEVIHSNTNPSQLETLGNISGNQFISTDGNFEATIEPTLKIKKAIAVQCLDGIVVILKHHRYYSWGKKVEGYWNSEEGPQYNMPIPNQLNEQEAKEVFALIKFKEKESELIFTRGFARSRIDGSIVGTNEYHHDEWYWPEGFAEHYVLKYKVRPSDDFLKFIGWIK